MRDQRGLSERRGLSDVLATALILAIIVMSFVITSGLWVGSFGSPSSNTLVKADQANIPAKIGLGASYVTCQSVIGASDSAFIRLYNPGTDSVTARVFDFQYNGTTVPIVPSGTCTISPGAGLYLVIVSLPFQAYPGERYSGYVSLTGGPRVAFSGAFL